MTRPVTKMRLYSGLALMGSACGTALAIHFIPADPFPAGALYLSAASLSAGMLLAPALASLQNPKAALRLEYLLLIGVVYWLLLDLLQGIYDLHGLKRASIEGAFLAIGLFACGVSLAGFVRPLSISRFVQESVRTPVSPQAMFRLILLFFALGMLKFAYSCNFDPATMIYFLGVNRWAAPWSRGRLGGWGAFLDHTTYFGYLVPLLTVALAMRSGWLRARTFSCIALSLTMMLFLAQGGGRRLVGVVAGVALIYWFLARPRVRLRDLLVAAACIGAVLYVLEIMLTYRNVGFSALLTGGVNQVELRHIHVDDNFYRLAQVVDIVPEKHPYLYYKPLAYALVRPIPRVFWPSKPTDPGFDLAQYIGARGVSLATSVLADWYLMGGFLTVFVGGFVYGVLARTGSVLLRPPTSMASRLLYAIVAMALFAGLRSLVDLVLMSYMVLAWLAGWWIVIRRRAASLRIVET